MRLEVEGLAARRGGDMIFEGIRFALGAGEAMAVTGPNGAGKSTLLRVLAGFLPPAAGWARVTNAADGAGDIAAHAHFLGPVNAMKPALTVRENLDFWRIFGDAPLLEPEEALGRLGLDHVIDVPYSDLSTGQRRRVAIARLLLNRRTIWLLDEPTSGLDANAEAVFAGLVGDHVAGGGIVIAATHLSIAVAGMKRLRFAERAPA
ncbi:MULTISPECIES: heme ABC exporter ATP-binding protein CcmA [unclassified Roseitalea]|uniref:heme ABC exporter ATP-binding protein CcmA n=1 Tax=unclassified Roseitalea TaxID=2639107 RepID=UPI00273F6D23|nr:MULTISPECIES: heme ABC exporter ATP-binding protein CcmA [unclassified Roseitalea]